ncbi:ribonuclease HI family protein [Candidatus Roizmanbacteria bacterium]|nr:ribonuclease HI family protein [Candidatus Roizmanbacteria bacterium]
MTLTIYTDGGSLNNPGEAASAYVIFQESTLLTENAVRIGIASNNIAEYSALIFALEKVIELIDTHQITQPESISVYSDSQLMISQLNGVYKIKHEGMRERATRVKNLINQIGTPVLFTHVLREKNMHADSLVKKALNS